MKTLSLVSGEPLSLEVDGVLNTYDTIKDRKRVVNKLIKSGYSFNSISHMDEFEGLCMAGENGINPWNCTILAGKYSISN